MRERIKEVVDSNGKSKFYPQFKMFGLFWTTYENPLWGAVRFDSLEKCRDFINYDRKQSIIIIHNV